MGFGADLSRVRRSLPRRGAAPVTQSQFASRFGLTLGAVKDAEQDRVAPSRAMRVLVAAIELDTELIDRAVVLAGERERVERTVRN